MNYIFLIIVIAIVIAVLVIATFTKFRLDDEQYDRLKWVVIRWSYLTTFIGLIAKTFDLPYGVETVTIVAGIGAMLAGLLGISTQSYQETQRITKIEDHQENQLQMAEDMLEEDELKQVKGE